ncbi:hypothetical protein Tco_0636955, partial [Tanacetum coccineum]
SKDTKLALKLLIKDHNKRNTIDLIRLNFELEDTEVGGNGIAKGKTMEDADLKKPFREALRTPLTRRIIVFARPKYKMPTNIKLMFQQTLDRYARRWFERLLAGSINEWSELREVFAARYSVRKACFKEPHEITKIVRKENESLTSFKERCTIENGFILGVPKFMKISAFMDSLKCPELAKSFRLHGTTKGEAPKHLRMTFLLAVQRDDRAYRNHQGGEEKGHHINDCIQLRKQLEMALESEKLNHLVKDVRKRGNPGETRIEGITGYTLHHLLNDGVSHAKGNINLSDTVYHHLRMSTDREKQIIKEKPREKEKEKEKEGNMKDVSVMEEVLVNPAFLEQLIIIRGGLLEECKSQLKLLLKNNMEIFAWEPAI